MNRQLAPGNIEKTGSCCFCIFYFLVGSIISGNCKSLEDDYYVCNGYENVMECHGMIIWPCCCADSFIKVPVVTGWLAMVYRLCLETVWTHKGKEGSYSGRGYTGKGSYGGYSGGYSGGDGLCAGGYTGDGSYDGYSRDVYGKTTYRVWIASIGEQVYQQLKNKQHVEVKEEEDVKVKQLIKIKVLVQVVKEVVKKMVEKLVERMVLERVIIEKLIIFLSCIYF